MLLIRKLAEGRLQEKRGVTGSRGGMIGGKRGKGTNEGRGRKRGRGRKGEREGMRKRREEGKGEE